MPLPNVSGFGDQASHDLCAAVGGHRHSRFAGAGDVECNHPDSGRRCRENEHVVHVHLPAVHPTGCQQHWGVCGQVGCGEDVHRHRGAGTPIRHVKYAPLEVHPEIRCGKQILLKLVL